MDDAELDGIVRNRIGEAIAGIVGEAAIGGETIKALSVDVRLTVGTPEGRPNRSRRFSQDWAAK